MKVTTADDRLMKSYLFYDTTPCSPLKVKRRFGGICCLHLQCRRISHARNKQSYGLILDPEDGGNMFIRNVG
jgi:hypothetical protein